MNPLDCPVCAVPMQLTPDRGRRCPHCSGLWVALGERRRLPERIPPGFRPAPTPRVLVCPTCPADLETLRGKGLEIDRCCLCGGLWLDAGELATLQELLYQQIEARPDPDPQAQVVTEVLPLPEPTWLERLLAFLGV